MTLKEQLRSEFKLMDVDGKGEISISNLKRVLNYDLKLNISDQLIDDMMNECSLGKSG